MELKWLVYYLQSVYGHATGVADGVEQGLVVSLYGPYGGDDDGTGHENQPY